MAKVSKKLEWCIVRLGSDMNWWVEEVSDPVHWDVDGLSIVDPKQMNYIVDHLEMVVPYGFQSNLIEAAFLKFAIDKDLGGGRIRLVRASGSFLAQDEVLFALPDILNEERGPFADFINSLTKSRVKMLNDLIDFESQFTIDELEEEIRDAQNEAYLEGHATHTFLEVISILEYVPEGYELDIEDEKEAASEEDAVEFDDLEEEELEEDETMRWDGDEDAEEDEESEDDEDFDDEDEEDDEDDDIDDRKKSKPVAKSQKAAPVAKKAAPSKAAAVKKVVSSKSVKKK